MLKLALLFTLFANLFCNDDFCYLESDCADLEITKQSERRYIFYDVNPSEGFNLRRDVYMRFAIFAHNMKKSANLKNFKLVLPPWSHLVHWKYSENNLQLPWHLYFNVDSMKKFAPVIEMYEFFAEINSTNKVILDEVYILQNFEDMFKSGNFEDRMQIDKCNRYYNLNYFFYANLTSNSVKCLSYHGSASKLDQLLLKSTAKTIFLHHGEIALHDMFGDRTYWQARRSMRFNKDLVEIANVFRKKYLHSSNEKDNTPLPVDYRNEKPRRDAKGGPYLAVHIRRRDFLSGWNDQVPDISSIVQQIGNKLQDLSLKIVFIATDASRQEMNDIKVGLESKSFNTMFFEPSDKVRAKFKDGGVAIIDQIICSHAKYFIGTDRSTFTFRIFEEREIKGFPVKTTFNAFCKDNRHCSKPSEWKIVF